MSIIFNSYIDYIRYIRYVEQVSYSNADIRYHIQVIKKSLCGIENNVIDNLKLDLAMNLAYYYLLTILSMYYYRISNMQINDINLLSELEQIRSVLFDEFRKNIYYFNKLVRKVRYNTRLVTSFGVFM